PNHGLINEYLSDGYLELCKYAVDKAEAMNMKIWLYDEYAWPSGFAGGHVPAQMPESWNQGYALKMTKVDRLKEEDINKYHVVLKKQDGEYLDISDKVSSETGKSGEYAVFEMIYQSSNNPWYGGFSYVDLIYPGVTEKFIEITMKDGYEKSFGDKFGSVVPGIFTDEPNISPRGGTIRWTPNIFSDFESRWGYKLQPHLVSLLEETGDRKKIRHNYFGLLLELFIERWSKPWYKYTEEHNLNWTGHYWEHGWPSPHHGGDNMAMYAWHQVPGIDMLMNNQEERPDQWGNVRSVKELSSVANQLNKERTLCEAFSGCGWDLSLEEERRLGSWVYTLGVNIMADMSYMSARGRRKAEWPRSISYQVPFWEDYEVMADYFRRLSFALTMGEQINKTLVIEPTTTAWMYYSPKESAPEFEILGEEFKSVLDNMEQYQLEYDLGCENIIKDHGKIENKKFVIGHRAYDLVVLPTGLKNIDRPTFELLKEYITYGGRVLSLVEPPAYIDGNETGEFSELISDNKESWIKVEGISDPEALEALSNQNFEVENPQGIQGKVFHHRRFFKDGQIIFWSNFDKHESASVSFSMAGEAVSKLDAYSGEIESYAYEEMDDNVKVQFDLEPGGNILFFVHEDEKEEFEGKIEVPVNEKKIKTELAKIKRTTPNVLMIDYVDLHLQGRDFRNVYFTAAGESAYQLNGMEKHGNYNPWVRAVQYKTSFVDMNEKFGENTGFTATYKFETDGNFVPESLRAVVEKPELYTIKINGKEVQPEEGKWWLDHSFGVFNIGKFVHPGRNELSLHIQPMNIHAEIEPVYLLGEFSLLSKEKGFRLGPPQELELGSWKEQKAPFYSHAVAYTKSFEAMENRHYKVRLNKWYGMVARVIVNGKKAGVIGWKPYELDITKWIDKGRNEVTIEVAGSLKNLFGPHHGVFKEGIINPSVYFDAPEHQPAGDQYLLDDYGLFEDFDLIAFEKQ
ncbi:glycosyl hydrolase, partial [Bacteroidota bacterium]